MEKSFYNELRKPSSAKSGRFINSARTGNGTAAHSGSVINFQKREKLKKLLIEKFMKKYHINTNENFIEEEVKNFLHKETLTDNDLKKLDLKIFELLQRKISLNQLEDGLKRTNDEKARSGLFNEELNRPDNTGTYNAPSIDECRDEEKRIKTAFQRRRDDDGISVRSGISHHSKSRKSDNKLESIKIKKKKDLTELTDEELELLSMQSHKNEPIERVRFENEKDEWDAINKYNQQVFYQDKINEKMKDKEVKRRCKEDLDNQIKQKMILQNEERMKNKEYDKITIDHVKVLNKLEEDRQREKKEKMLREKSNRDAQRIDEKKRKRIEDLKNKKYEKELCKSFEIFNI